MVAAFTPVHADRDRKASIKMATRDELEFVAELVRIARADRDIYRQIRAEAWAMVQQNHAHMSECEHEAWTRTAS